MAVYRIYTEKKPQYAVEAQSVLSDLRTALRLDVQGIRVLNRYDADRIDAEDFQKAIPTVFSEPAVDYVYEKLPLLAMTRGEFHMPLRNTLRVQPGVWADFIGVVAPEEPTKAALCCERAEALTGIEARILEG